MSNEFFECFQKFSKDTGLSHQSIFDRAIVNLWRIWNNDSEAIEVANHECYRLVETIMLMNPMPGKVSNHFIHIGFRGAVTFEFFNSLEKLRFFHDTHEGIRRILSWYLKDRGYLTPHSILVNVNVLKEKRH